jgi:CheY-specific phosphatase CheX
MELIDTSKHDLKDLLKPIIDRAEEYLENDLGIKIGDYKYHKSTNKKDIRTVHYTTSISVNGVLNGKFIMSIDSDIIKESIKIFIGEGLDDEFINSLLPDTTSEILNIILGNSIVYIENLSISLKISPPTIIEESDLDTLEDTIIHIFEYATNKGKIIFYYLE